MLDDRGEPRYLILASARKHGVSDADMLHAIRHYVWKTDMPLDRLMYAGPGYDGQSIEVGVARANDFPGAVVIHAMSPARGEVHAT